MVVHWWPDASSAQRPRTSAHISLLPMLLNFNSLSATQINVMKSQQSAVVTGQASAIPFPPGGPKRGHRHVAQPCELQ